jgi:Uma2 family endonuclease
MLTVSEKEIKYPDHDGNPMADNTLQLEWLVKLKVNLDILFESRADVFVACDLLWYPIEGDEKTRSAPDAMVVFGRPKGYRGSYKQWEEGGIAPQVVFEILSPSNTVREMEKKRQLYERFGVEEYYEYDPYKIKLKIAIRSGDKLKEVEQKVRFESPRLETRFEITDETLRIYFPDGRPFESGVDINARANIERDRADSEQQRADNAQDQVLSERRRADKLAEKLRELGIDPDTL